jgi:FKBP-type peptidyl-prolyl cis-trans isomerase FkpA
MRVIAASLFLATILLTGCLKKYDDCTYSIYVNQAPASEEQMLSNYLTSNNITATKHASNMYYEIVTQGSGPSPELCSGISIDYVGKLTNGTIFDQGSEDFVLGILIDGWKWGLPLIQKGGQIKLYIPPSLGYGPTDVKDGNTVIVPGNSILIFDIKLKDVY